MEAVGSRRPLCIFASAEGSGETRRSATRRLTGARRRCCRAQHRARDDDLTWRGISDRPQLPGSTGHRLRRSRRQWRIDAGGEGRRPTVAFSKSRLYCKLMPALNVAGSTRSAVGCFPKIAGERGTPCAGSCSPPCSPLRPTKWLDIWSGAAVVQGCRKGRILTRAPLSSIEIRAPNSMSLASAFTAVTIASRARSDSRSCIRS